MTAAERKLIRWAGAVLDAHRNDGYPGDVDGGTLQDLAVKHGVIVPVPVKEACGEVCSCAEYDDFPQDCYRLEALVATTLTEAEAEPLIHGPCQEKT